MSTIFGKIIAGDAPCTKVYETPYLLAIEDISPQAPVHLLLLLKEEFSSLQQVPPEKWFLFGEVVAAAQYLAEKYGVPNHYRLVTNIGP